MKKFHSLLAVLSIMVACGVARADSIPGVTGIWTGQYPVFLPGGSGHSKLALDITSQNGEGFNGHVDWKRTDFTAYPGVAPEDVIKVKVTSGRAKVVGVIGFDGKTIEMASPGGKGVMHGYLTGKNTMRIIFVKESDPVVTFRAVLTRADH